MKLIYLLALLSILNVFSASAQFAVVVDEGGFVNVYDDEKEELDRLGSDGVVAIQELDDEWALVDYTKYGDYAASSGYIKKKNLIAISTYKEIPLVTDSTNMVMLSDGNITIKLSSTAFVKEDNKIAYFSELSDVISTINEEEHWGTKTVLPESQYKSIVCKKGEESNFFPEEALFNLFNPHLKLTKAYYDAENDIVYLLSPNGDAEGAYTALWVIEQGVYAIHYIFD